MTEHEKKDKSNLASWKIDLEDTVNGDPDLPACALNILRVYLHFLTEENPNPFCAMSKLMARTNLSAPTIKRARAKLISLGYMVAKGASAGKGATQYELRNPRRDLVQRLISEREAELQKASGEKRKADTSQSKRDQNFTPSNDLNESRDQGSKFTPQRDQNVPTTGVENDPLSTVDISVENTVEGAAQAAPHQGIDNNSDSGEAAFADASGSPIGEEEGYPADDPSFADEDEFVADDDDDDDDDDGEGGIPYDAKSEDHPEGQGTQPPDTASDLLTRCLRREQYLTGGDRRRLHVILASFRGGQPIADADLDALTVILARLEGGDEFADDLSEIDPDLSEPTTATAAATEIWRQ